MLDPYVLTRPGTIVLDTARPDAVNRWSLCFTAPHTVLSTTSPSEVPDLLNSVEASTRAGHYAAGFLSYEAGYPYLGLEPPPTGQEPVAWFGLYDEPTRLAPGAVSRGLSRLDGSAPINDVALSVSRAAYVEALDNVHAHIQAGDVYQINYTAPVHFRTPGDPRVLYRRMRRRQHVPYGAYLHLGDRQILSCSPELFLRREKDRVVTRPMKGTIRRGRTLEEDRRLRTSLANDPKNRAENLMIVDLLRNDLSRCCRPGSVTVPSMYTTEPYDTVTQMTSTVEGRLEPGVGVADLMNALFPCGSVTGAPKRRAMRIIRELEQERRGVYCGAIGMVGPDASATFNVAIRTVVVEGDRGKMGVGSGVVWDSDPQTEYDECTLKTQFLTPSRSHAQGAAAEDPLRLIETMRVEDGEVPFLDRHVERLGRSAAYFDYPFDETHFRRRVTRVAAQWKHRDPAKLRVTLGRWGRLRTEVTPIETISEGAWALSIAAERVDPSDPLFYHKTTHRAVYDRARRAAEAAGCDEALLLNENGALTEGTYSNVFVQKGEALWTPPVKCGLLPGVYRQYVLDTDERAGERVLTLDDLAAADAIYCCNAVRGWQDAQLPSSVEAATA